jgi:anti-sigma regulatory factor (Ser/Thr protein kinase)
MAEYSFTYASRLESEDQMLDDIQAVLELHQIVGARAWRLALVVSEAFTNALVHGNASDPQRLVGLAIKVNESEIVADISDEGACGLDRIAHRIHSGDILAENGRGIGFMERYADRVEYRESPAGGLVVSLTVRLTEASITLQT